MSNSDLRAVALALVFIALAALAWLLYAQHGKRKRSGAQPYTYGVDFSWSRPTAEQLRSLGYTFVCRYYSWDTSGKNLTVEEAQYWQAYGFDIVGNWEYYTNAPQGGYTQGVADASEAVRQHVICGANRDMDPVMYSVDYDVPVYAAVDGRKPSWWTILCRIIRRLVNELRRAGISLFGGTPNEYLKVADYFRGIISVHGTVATVGAYGEYDIIRRLFDDGLISYGWQTYAWSYGEWEPRAQLRQVKNGLSVGGQSYDRNEAWAKDFGQWGGSAPQQRNGDGTVLLNCPFDTDRTDLFYVGPANEVWHAWWTGGINAMWAGENMSKENLGGRIVQGTLTALWTPSGNDIYISGLGQGSSVATPTGSGQYWAMALDRYGQRSGWGSVEHVYGQMPV